MYNKLFNYKVCLFIVIFLVSFVIKQRYSSDYNDVDIDLGFLIGIACVISMLLIMTLLMISASAYDVSATSDIANSNGAGVIIPFKETEDYIIKSVLTSVYSAFFFVYIIQCEYKLFNEKKKGLLKLLIKSR